MQYNNNYIYKYLYCYDTNYFPNIYSRLTAVSQSAYFFTNVLAIFGLTKLLANYYTLFSYTIRIVWCWKHDDNVNNTFATKIGIHRDVIPCTDCSFPYFCFSKKHCRIHTMSCRLNICRLPWQKGWKGIEY